MGKAKANENTDAERRIAKDLADAIAELLPEAKPSADLPPALSFTQPANKKSSRFKDKCQQVLSMQASADRLAGRVGVKKRKTKQDPSTWSQMVLARRTIVASLFLRNYSPAEILANVNMWLKRTCAADDELSIHTIHADIVNIKAEWRQRKESDIADRMSIEIEKLDDREREAMDAWHRSIGEIIEMSSTTGDKDNVTKKTSLSAGDPAFLAMAIKTQELRLKLLGGLKADRRLVTLTDAAGNPVDPPTEGSSIALTEAIKSLKDLPDEDLVALEQAAGVLGKLNPGLPTG